MIFFWKMMFLLIPKFKWWGIAKFCLGLTSSSLLREKLQSLKSNQIMGERRVASPSYKKFNLSKNKAVSKKSKAGKNEFREDSLEEDKVREVNFTIILRQLFHQLPFAKKNCKYWKAVYNTFVQKKPAPEMLMKLTKTKSGWIDSWKTKCQINF